MKLIAEVPVSSGGFPSGRILDWIVIEDNHKYSQDKAVLLQNIILGNSRLNPLTRRPLSKQALDEIGRYRLQHMITVEILNEAVDMFDDNYTTAITIDDFFLVGDLYIRCVEAVKATITRIKVLFDDFDLLDMDIYLPLSRLTDKNIIRVVTFNDNVTGENYNDVGVFVSQYDRYKFKFSPFPREINMPSRSQFRSRSPSPVRSRSISPVRFIPLPEQPTITQRLIWIPVRQVDDDFWSYTIGSAEMRPYTLLYNHAYLSNDQIREIQEYNTTRLTLSNQGINNFEGVAGYHGFSQTVLDMMSRREKLPDINEIYPLDIKWGSVLVNGRLKWTVLIGPTDRALRLPESLAEIVRQYNNQLPSMSRSLAYTIATTQISDNIPFTDYVLTRIRNRQPLPNPDNI